MTKQKVKCICGHEKKDHGVITCKYCYINWTRIAEAMDKKGGTPIRIHKLINQKFICTEYRPVIELSKLRAFLDLVDEYIEAVRVDAPDRYQLKYERDYEKWRRKLEGD